MEARGSVTGVSAPDDDVPMDTPRPAVHSQLILRLKVKMTGSGPLDRRADIEVNRRISFQQARNEHHVHLTGISLSFPLTCTSMVAFSPRRPPQSLSFYIRRSARYYLLFLLLAAFISLGYISDQQSRLPSAELQPPNDNDDDHSKVVQSNVEHAVDAFVRGFPRLRGPEVRGVPVVDGLDERGEGEERTVFDWPKTTHMFVL